MPRIQCPLEFWTRGAQQVPMSELKQGIYAGATADMVQALLDEFVDDTLDTLSRLSADQAALTDVEEIRRIAFHVKGQAQNFGLGNVALVAQRLENYLGVVDTLDARGQADLVVYIDSLIDTLEDKAPADDDPARLARRLPARPSGFDPSEVQVQDIEVLLVMLHGTQTRFVEREMQACGYRVSIVTSPFAAFEQVVRTKPEMVVISAVMPELSGINLVAALAAMPETRNIPVALITSLEPEDDQLKLLPENIPVIRKGASFGDDLVDALDRYFLL